MYNEVYKLAQVLIELLRNRPRVRFWLTLTSSILLVTSLVLTVFLFFIITESGYERFRPPSLIANIFLLYLFAISLLSYSTVKLDDNFKIQLEELHEERKDLKRKISLKEKADILDTIQLNLNQLSEYYTINKGQARNSFRISVSAIVLGLFTLLAGIWFFYLRETTSNITLATLSGVSGVLLQFIGGAYFYLYRKSLEQLNFFFSQLVKMQDTMLSIKLCEQITKEDRQIDVREKIILSLLERSLLVAEIFQMRNSIKEKQTNSNLIKE
jgi:Cyanobacterial TRADD-N associated 2-Transmembrane domain